LVAPASRGGDNGGDWVGCEQKSTLRLKSWHRLKEVEDPHAILVSGEGLVVTSTGNDRVISYPCRGSEVDLTSANILWIPPGSRGQKDTHHLNSICFKGDSLLVSAFGLKVGRLWKSARRGYIFDTTRNREVLGRLSHPHSLLADGEDLFYCESTAARVKKNESTFYEFRSGYTRGLAKIGHTLIVGRSSWRRVSRSTGLVSHFEGWGSPIGGCSLTFLDLVDRRVVGSIDLGSFHDEIFDILAVKIDRPVDFLSTSKILLKKR